MDHSGPENAESSHYLCELCQGPQYGMSVNLSPQIAQFNDLEVGSKFARSLSSRIKRPWPGKHLGRTRECALAVANGPPRSI